MKFTGEFFVPPNAGDDNNNSELEIEHKQRYLSILKMVEGKRVLDIASGEGYGTHILSSKASFAFGVDINPELIEHAGQKYTRENLRYLHGSVERIPLESGSIDIIVSFETMEHVDADLQKQFVIEVRRVLKEGGVFIVSTPNRKNYTDRYEHHNKFHVHELDEDAFGELLAAHFGHVRLYHQGLEVSSLILNKEDYLFQKPVTIVPVNKDAYHFESKYLIGLCSDRPEAIETSITSIVPESEKSYFQLIDRILQLQREVEELGAWGTRTSAEVETLIGERSVLQESVNRSAAEKEVLAGEIEALSGERSALTNELDLARKNISYYSDTIQRMQEDLARSNHKAFLLEAELETLQKIHSSKKPPSFGLEELTVAITHLNGSITRSRTRSVQPAALPVKNDPPPVQTPSVEHFKQQIKKLEEQLDWYKKTYQKRSLLGVVKQKIADGFHN
jgi:SAM-dependent methyltransferase